MPIAICYHTQIADVSHGREQSFFFTYISTIKSGATTKEVNQKGHIHLKLPSNKPRGLEKTTVFLLHSHNFKRSSLMNHIGASKVLFNTNVLWSSHKHTATSLFPCLNSYVVLTKT